MNKIKEIKSKIKELEEEVKKLEKEESDERIKVGMDDFHYYLVKFEQEHSTFSDDPVKIKFQKEAEELVETLTDVLRNSLSKQWKYFEDQKKEKCHHISFFEAVLEVMKNKVLKD